MLPVSVDCLFLIVPSVFSNVYLSCVPNVTSVVDCLILIVPSVFSNVYLSCVLNVTSVRGLSNHDCSFGFL